MHAGGDAKHAIEFAWPNLSLKHMHGFACRLINSPLISCGLLFGFIEKLSVDCHHKGHVVRQHYSNSLMVSSCNLNWFDTTV